MQTRRSFLRNAAAVGVGSLIPWSVTAAPKPATARRRKFIDPLISAIPTLVPETNPLYPGADYYEIYMAGGRWSFSSRLPVTAARFGADYVGVWFRLHVSRLSRPTIEARRGRPVVVNFMNLLDPALPHPVQAAIDPAIPDPAMEGVLPPGRATPHWAR